jgi:hypothetical protein
MTTPSLQFIKESSIKSIIVVYAKRNRPVKGIDAICGNVDDKW